MINSFVLAEELIIYTSDYTINQDLGYATNSIKHLDILY
jgi:hypothetical protein